MDAMKTPWVLLLLSAATVSYAGEPARVVRDVAFDKGKQSILRLVPRPGPGVSLRMSPDRAQKMVPRSCPRGSISYTLDAPAYVRLRVGAANGPLYATLVNWERRGKGRHRVPYSDTVSGNTAFTLHVYTRDDADAYGLSLKDLLLGPEQTAIGQALSSVRRSQIHKQHPRRSCYDPPVSAHIPGAAHVRGAARIHNGSRLVIGLGKKEKRWFSRERFQVHIFVDDVLMHQDMKGYVPYMWNINTTGLNPGRHTILVNLAGFADHIGAAKIEVLVE